MFWKSFPRTSRIYFPPPPLTMLIFSDRTNFWNTEIVIFNIDMGEGEEQFIYHREISKIMYFPKIFAHDCSYWDISAKTSAMSVLMIIPLSKLCLRISPRNNQYHILNCSVRSCLGIGISCKSECLVFLSNHFVLGLQDFSSNKNRVNYFLPW